MQTLENKIILITGAASGIGRATAVSCARKGASLFLSDIDEDGVSKTAKIISDVGGQAEFSKTDITQAIEVKRLVDDTITSWGRIDGAFNNAGIEGDLCNTVHWSEEAFDRTISVNLKGVWLCLKYQIEQMLIQGNGGSIVNTSSVAGLIGARGSSGYAASKHGVVGLTKTAAIEFASKGVRINAICPGMVETPMLGRLVESSRFGVETFIAQEPIGRFGKPEEIGETVTWLLSNDSSFVTGIALPVDGGFVAQ